MIKNSINIYNDGTSSDLKDVSLSEVISLIGELAKDLSYKASYILPDNDIPKGIKLILQCLINQNGITQLDIVRFTGYKPPTISILIKRMEALGYIKRSPDEYDHRAVRVYITDKGSNIYHDAVRIFKSIETTVLKGITEEETKAMVSAMKKIKENLKYL